MRGKPTPIVITGGFRKAYERVGNLLSNRYEKFIKTSN